MLPESYLDHIAIAVSNLDEAQKIYEDLGLTFSKEREVVASQGVETAFAQLDQRAKLELLCPYGKEGPIHQFLAKKGPGIHHICLRVEDVALAGESLKQKGYKLLYETPQKGAHGCLVNFVHPKSTGGVLIEISQKGN